MVYRVWRGAERGRWEEWGLRYDLTLILAGEIGGELNKTFGHYHAPLPLWPQGFPELYQVLEGRGLFLLQRPGGREVALSLAGPGEAVFIPPGFGHLTVNVGPEPLLVSNLVLAEGEALYEPFARSRGGAWYVLKGDELAGFRLRPNPSYSELGLPRLRPPLYLSFRLLDRVRDCPEEFRFLLHPEAELPFWMRGAGSEKGEVLLEKGGSARGGTSPSVQ